MALFIVPLGFRIRPAVVDVRVLVVDSDLLSRRTIAVMLDGLRHQVMEAASIDDAVATVSAHPVDVVLSGSAFGRTRGVALLAAIKNIRPEVRVAVIGEVDPEEGAVMDAYLNLARLSSDLRRCIESRRTCEHG